MFLSFVVAIWSAIVGLSEALAAVCLPFIVGALVRTMRVRRGTAAGEPPPGLLATFCRSLAILLGLVAVAAMALGVACGAGMLVVLGVAGRLLTPIAILSSAWARYGARVSTYAWRRLWSPAVRLKVLRAFLMMRELALAATRSLIAMCRRLWRHWWKPELRYG